jgi:hypothetical protein
MPAPVPFPSRDQPDGAPPARPGTIGWPAVPVAVAATLALTWLSSLLAGLFRSDGDSPTVARAVYLAVSVVALGGIALLARRRAPVAAPWAALAALAATVTFVAMTVVLFVG